MILISFHAFQKKIKIKIKIEIKKKKGPIILLGLSGQKKSLAATYSPILLCIVPSAKRGLTAEFGMGSGVSLSLLPPGKNHLVITKHYDIGHWLRKTLENI